jgi:Domain of unknown function (DUF5655)
MNNMTRISSRWSDIDRHFTDRSENVRFIYDAILKAARKCGDLVEDPKKTSIHLNRVSAFAGIQTRRDFLVLTVKSSSAMSDPLIARSEQTSANRWHHEIKISSPEQVAGSLIDWIKNSYELSG